MGFCRVSEGRRTGCEQLLLCVSFFKRAGVRQIKVFSDAYSAKFQSAPPPLAALAYDSIWLLADALKRSGVTEPAALRDAIAATRDFPGVTGSISFDQGRDPKKAGIVIRVQDGKFTYLETTEP